jgi:hypothetical protein
MMLCVSKGFEAFIIQIRVEQVYREGNQKVLFESVRVYAAGSPYYFILAVVTIADFESLFSELFSTLFSK